MLALFEALLRSNFRFGRMLRARATGLAGRFAAPAWRM